MTNQTQMVATVYENAGLLSEVNEALHHAGSRMPAVRVEVSAVLATLVPAPRTALMVEVHYLRNAADEYAGKTETLFGWTWADCMRALVTRHAL